MPCFQVFGISPSSQILLYIPSRYFSVSGGSFLFIWGWIVSSPGAVFFCWFLVVFSFLSVNGLLYGGSSSFCFSLVCFSYVGYAIYLHSGLQRCLRFRQVRLLCFLLCPVVCSFQLLSRNSPIPFWLWFWSLVTLWTYSMCLFWKLFLIALLQWNVLNLFLFVGSRQHFLYSALIILSSLSHSSFHLRMFWGWFSL